jgi:parallel beta-helix repeat protein
LVIDSNAISNMRSGTGVGVGIIFATGTSKGARIQDNVLTGNAVAGLMIMGRNTDNLVRDNVSRKTTGFGIRIQAGSTNNTFVDNRMSSNGTDARDDTDDPSIKGVQILNTGINNKCTSDLPLGALCDVE